MRIGIDARLYGPRQGGLGRYLEQLIHGLEKTDQNNDYIVFLRQENFNDYIPENPRFKKILADIPWYGWREQFCLPKILKREKLDFIHFPHWNIPLFYKEKFVVTIHDLILYHYPSRKASTLSPITYFLKNLTYKFVLHHSVKKAKYIFTPSEFTKQDIINTLHIPADKITVTYLAPTDLGIKFTPLNPAKPEFRDERNYLTGVNPVSSIKYTNGNVLSKHNITKPYLLYVGVAYPHKNLGRLVNAWKMFEEKNKNFQLVLVGKKNYFYDRLINSDVFKQCKNIVFTDFVSDKELSELYQNATAYIFPSLYEGFGLPPLEAMQYNIPVISSNTSCLPEILDESVLYFNPQNEQDIYSKISMILTQPEIRQKLINNIPNILANYSQNNTSKITLSVYQKMI